jgi:tetratricopeptide (TPR) repeat protein
MAEAIKRDEAGNIANKLNECKKNLQKGNLFSCLLAFKEALEKMNSTRMLPADEKALNEEINIFQQNLSASSAFRDLYGPVTFRDNDIAPALALMQQLIEIKEEEIKNLVSSTEEGPVGLSEASPEEHGIDAEVKQIKILIEKGDFATAQEMLQDHEDLVSILADGYNSAGIESRRAGRFDEAIAEFKKAMVVCPRDEGLYYNIARVYVAKHEWEVAAKTINEGLKINPHFEEGIKLLKYIRENGELE